MQVSLNPTGRIVTTAPMNKPEQLSDQLKIIQIGDEAGVILPRQMLERLQVQVGDVLACSPTPEGTALSANDPELDRQMEKAHKIMKRYRNALSELAK
jgi:putative addiction module antidote